jgi:plasmid stabilization system protein ParE
LRGTRSTAYALSSGSHAARNDRSVLRGCARRHPTIAAYTIEKWNEAQADFYLANLEAFCEGLSDTLIPRRPCAEVSAGLFRANYVSHIVFYRLKPYGIRVVRLLGGAQEPKRHSFDDDDGRDE